MDRMGRTDQLARCLAGRYLTFDPAEVIGCSATLYATDTRQPAQLHSLCAGRLSSPTPPHYAYVCVLRWNVWAVRGTCLAVAEHVLRMRGRPGAEADLRHVSVSEHPTTDICVTCTYLGMYVQVSRISVVGRSDTETCLRSASAPRPPAHAQYVLD